MSEDEDDLEALRIAALATLKRKPAVQAPQGIPVVGSIQTHISVGDVYPRHIAAPDEHVVNELSGQFVSEYDDVPIEVQRWFEQGPRGRGRGFHQGWGRGRGRGRGNYNNYNNFPKPSSSTSLIVLTSSAEEENSQAKEAKDSPKPLLLRPQDKWASTDSGSSVSFSPPRTKDTSKFRRYDEDSESEEEEEDGERQEQVDSEAESSHMDIDDHRTVVLKNFGDVLNRSTETENASEHLLDTSGELDMSGTNTASIANISILSLAENVNTSGITTTDGNTEENADSTLKENNSDSDLESEVEDKLLHSDVDTPDKNYHTDVIEKYGSVAELQSDNNESDMENKKENPSEQIVQFSEIDNVSNSNSAVFSRFNRRPRRDSNSENDNSDNENNNAIFDQIQSRPEIVHSRRISLTKPSRSRSASPVSSVSASSFRQVSSPSPAKTSPQLTKLQSDDNSSSEDASSESESDTDSSSAASSKHSPKSLSPKSLSPTRSASPSPVRISRSPHSHNKQISPPNKTTRRSIKSDKPSVSKSPSPRRRDPEQTRHIQSSKLYSDTGKTNLNYNDRSAPIKRNSSGGEISHGRSRSPTRRRSPEVSSEFDARNYRQIGMYIDTSSKDKPADSAEPVRHQYDKKRNQKDMTLEEKEKRHFEEITRIKKEELKQKLSEVDSKLIEARRKKFDIAYAGSLEQKISMHKAKHKSKEEDKKKVAKSNVTELKKEKLGKEDNRKDKVTDKPISTAGEHEICSRKAKQRQKQNPETSRSRPLKTPVKVEKRSKSKQKSSHSSEKKKSLPKRKKKNRDDKKSDSESAKSVSSISDSESESETETWRNKKVGASRKMDDIERERRQRQAQEREQNRLKSREEDSKRPTIQGTHRHREQNRNRYEYDEDRSGRFNRDRDRGYISGRGNQDRHPKEKVYHRKNMTFYEEEPSTKHQKFFEEHNSDDETEVSSKRGVISVVRSDRLSNSEKMVDLKISKTQTEPSEKSTKLKLSKKERLVIKVEQTGADQGESKSRKSVKRKEEKAKKRERKKKDNTPDSDNEEPVKHHKKQVVNVTFDQDDARGPVHDRLGLSVKDRLSSDKGRSRHKDQVPESGMRRSQDVGALSGGKRMKLNEGGKYKVTDRLGYHGENTKDSGSQQDEGLSKKIRKIKEKNAEIIRRRQEIEEDREQYG